VVIREIPSPDPRNVLRLSIPSPPQQTRPRTPTVPPALLKSIVFFSLPPSGETLAVPLRQRISVMSNLVRHAASHRRCLRRFSSRLRTSTPCRPLRQTHVTRPTSQRENWPSRFLMTVLAIYIPTEPSSVVKVSSSSLLQLHFSHL